MDRAETLAALRAALPELRRRYGVVRLALFGSLARGEAGPDSDVDLIAEFAVDARLGFRFFELEEELAALLGRPVQISALSRMNSFVRANVERDLIDVAA